MSGFPVFGEPFARRFGGAFGTGGGGVPWYLAGGIAPASIAAIYQPIGASSLANSYINIANPGTKDITAGVAPGWYTNVGWVFNGTTQYLKTGVIVQGSHTLIIGVRAIAADMNGIIIGGQAANGLYIQPYYTAQVGYINNSIVYQAPGATKAVLAIAGSQGFRDGVAEITGLTQTTNTTQETYIGARNASGTAGIFRPGEVYAVALYNTTLTDAQVLAVSQAMARLPAQYGQNALAGVINQQAQLGNVLNFEYTQPWSVGVTIQKYPLVTGTGMIFTNVSLPAGGDYPGYEIYTDTTNVFVRLIHDVAAAQDCRVHANCTLTDGRQHRLWVTYDGSGTAAGIKIYLDGVSKTVVVDSDTLGGLSIIGAGQNFTIGNQQGYTDTLYFRGRMQNLVLDTVVRDATYVSNNSEPYAIPAADAGTRQLLLRFNEGSGLSASDGSGNGYDATLTANSMWYSFA